MRKKLLLAALLALVAPAIWLGAGGNGGGQDNALGFGKRIAGGWLATLDLGSPVDALMTLGADGTIVLSGQLRWAGPDNTGGWEGTRYNTTAHGSWVRTGPNDIAVVALLQVQDNDGGLVFYEKVGLQLTLDVAATKLEGTGYYQLFEAGVDPLDPSSSAKYEGQFTETLRAIR